MFLLCCLLVVIDYFTFVLIWVFVYIGVYLVGLFVFDVVLVVLFNSVVMVLLFSCCCLFSDC